MSAGGSGARSWRRLGLRREVMILLPVVLLLLVVLSLFTLSSYRNAVGVLLVERRSEAARLARAAAVRLAREGSAGGQQEALRSFEPLVGGAALFDGDGRILAAVGELPNALPPGPGAAAPGEAEGGDDPLALVDEAGGTVSGTAPWGQGEGRRYVRVDLPAETLAAQARALKILGPSVLVLDFALVLLSLFFLRHLLLPYEKLLAGARGLGAEGGEENELQFLLSVFERAAQALGRAAQGTEAAEPDAEGDLAALERTLSVSLQSGLLLLDRHGDVLALNPVGARLLGIDGTPQGRSLADLLAAEPELRDLLLSAVQRGEAPARQECSLRGPDGNVTVGLTVHPLRRDDGAVRGFLVLFADLTEPRRQAEERRLADSLAQLGELAGGVAHELRNSLATLRGYLTLIERRPGEESLADYLSEIRREADHLGRVLEDFLAFARPGSARAEVVSLASLVRAAAGDPQLGDAGVRVALAEGSEGAWVRVDPQLLERALRNLLHNAAQAEAAAGGTGPVLLSVQAGPEGVEIVVEDRGAGISPEVRGRLFHPFVTGRRGGVGLGLALTQRIVVLHGGRVRLEDREGGGARAVIALPPDIVVTARNDEGASALAGPPRTDGP